VNDELPQWARDIDRGGRFTLLGKPPNTDSHWIHSRRENGIYCDYWIDRGDRTLLGAVRFGAQTEGHSNIVHGGAITTLVDDALGTTAWLAGENVVTLSIQTTFRKFVKVGDWARVDAEVSGATGKQVKVTCRITNSQTGVLHAEAEGLFLQLNPAKHVAPRKDQPAFPWVVERTDDNGNSFVLAGFKTEAEANDRVSEFENHQHNQIYVVRKNA
jgi:acyl-coenzyme A thioesterase PaaI-like protein